jgi:mannose/fructose/N-acetylgalactosamine-specific phosphotransferase system component IIC
MTLFQAALIGLVYYLGNSSLLVGPIGYYTVYRPLVGGFIVGLILGNPVMGTIVGATINLMYIGFISAGGALPGDMCLAGVLGTAFAISGGLGAEAALAIAVPIGLIGWFIWVARLTIDTFFAHMADKMADKGDVRGVWRVAILYPQGMLFFITAIPCFVAAYFGSAYIASILDFVGPRVLGVLGLVGAMMPALGIALNLKAIYKGEAKVFFFFGFLMAVYSGLSMIAVGLLAGCIAIIVMQLKKKEVA